MKKVYIFTIIVSFPFLCGCAMLKPQVIYLDDYSTYELQAMLNQIDAQLQYYQYYPPKTYNDNYGRYSGTIGFLEGMQQGQIQNLLYQRAMILTELQRRQYQGGAR